MYRLALFWFAILPVVSLASVFEDARQAAQEGRYRAVVEILTTALESGKIDAADEAVAYSNRGIAYSLLHDYDLAERDLQRALSLDPDHSLTLNHLGLLNERIHKNVNLAASYYQRAVDTGFAASQVNLGNLYRLGLGVKRDYRMALHLYELAAKQQYSTAYVSLGMMYSRGQGTAGNSKRALEFYLKGAELGVVVAHFHLGGVFERGLGTAADSVLAVEHYRLAAMQGHGEAQNRLGYMYHRGHGVERDYIKAAMWYELASEQGVLEAKNRLSWLLAGCPVENVCNGDLAIRIALEALAFGSEPTILDTLAAAYARTGRFGLAIKTLEDVLVEMPKNTGQSGVYQNRLDSYRMGLPLQL